MSPIRLSVSLSTRYVFKQEDIFFHFLKFPKSGPSSPSPLRSIRVLLPLACTASQLVSLTLALLSLLICPQWYQQDIQFKMHDPSTCTIWNSQVDHLTCRLKPKFLSWRLLLPTVCSCPPLLPAVPSLAQLPPTERTSLPPSPGPPGVTSALLPPELPRSLFCGPSASRHLYHEGQQCFQITRFLHLLFLSFQILELSIMWVTAVHIPVLAYKHSIDTVEPRRIFPKQNGSG